jgi:gamma-glutamyltranspeptidase/glutathione hydrolase
MHTNAVNPLEENALMFSSPRGYLPTVVACLLSPPLFAAERADTIEAKNGVVVTVSGPASEVGLAVLKDGGNAVDAAVATAFALAVTWPEAGNIGGGGYMVVHHGEKQFFFDFRETAPAAATRDMFVKRADRTAHRRAGVPGTVRGLALAHQKLGKRPWKDLVMPAVKLARDGFVLDAATAGSLNGVLRPAKGEDRAELRRVFGRGDGKWKAGDVLIQPDLAKTLERIAEKGPEGFYTGETAELLVAEMQRGGGLITKEDLAGYPAIERIPLHGTYRGYDVYSVPPSSSGGTCLIEMLNILENFDLGKMGRWSPETLHVMIEAMRRGYRDRAAFLADPAFVKVPDRLTSKPYAKELAKGIDPMKATPSASLAGDIRLSGESQNTTHFSVIDKDRMAVSLTYTLEDSFGGKVMVKGAGFLLNDQMNDFNWLPGVTDRSGRIGTDANLVAPGKRMLSSQTPTIVAKDGKPILITGSPGGRTIINTVFGIIINVIDFDMDSRAAVDAPRLHHQWFPDRMDVERGLSKEHAETLERLKQMGHVIHVGAAQGDAHSIWVNPKSGRIIGAADRRRSGSAVGY